MTPSALVSVIVAVHNEERHIAACLESLLAQTYRPLEIVVVDDGSSDRTADVVGRYDGVRLVRQQQGGRARAINHGVGAAAGEVVVFADGDLVFEPDYVERLVRPILAGECIGSAHATEYVANPGNVWAACLQVKAGLPADRRLVLTPAQLAEGSIVFRAIRTSEFRRVGGFDDFGYLDDQTLCPKLGARARWVSEATCSHNNPDLLREVWAAGVWAAQSIARLHGFKALGRYQPLLSLPRALADAWSQRRPSLVAYDCVYDAGVSWGLVRQVLTGRRA
jgi:glycosyltransferase involved in cell wall biosynthesis